MVNGEWLMVNACMPTGRVKGKLGTKKILPQEGFLII
jgi:hypothetical protein